MAIPGNPGMFKLSHIGQIPAYRPGLSGTLIDKEATEYGWLLINGCPGIIKYIYVVLAVP